MTGVQYVVDENGNKTAAIIDLAIHKELWEDFEDLLVSRSREDEENVSFEQAKAQLIASGKLRG